MEIFKDITDYEDLYEVGTNGTVRSKDKVATYKGQSYLKGRVLKQGTTTHSHTTYKHVTLSKNSKTKRFLVHRLVATHFVPNEDNKPQVNHIDNDGSNNNYQNLEWVTHKENMKHSETQGRQVKSHYLGGVACGGIKRDEAKLRWDKRIGETFGGYILLTIDTYGKHPRGTVKCIRCNKVLNNRVLDSIITGESYGCRSCALKKSYRDNKR
jgi:hypothetical protein